MQARVIDVGGTPVTLLEAGEGAPVLYLHGIDGPEANPLLDELAKTHRVIVPQWPGFGHSAVPDWMIDIGDAALFGLDLLAALPMPRPHGVGHANGGWIATEMAIRDSAAFASLTLIAPAGIVPADAPKHDVFLLPGELAVRAQFHDGALADRALAARAGQPIDIMLQNRTGLARIGWSPRLASIHLPHWLHRVACPTLLVWGEEDQLIPFANHAVFLREIAGIAFLPLPACGHAVPHEAATPTAARMRTLWETRA